MVRVFFLSFLIYDMNTINHHLYSDYLIWIGFNFTDTKGIGIKFESRLESFSDELLINKTVRSLDREMTIYELMDIIDKEDFEIEFHVFSSWVINGWKKKRLSVEVDEVDTIVFLQFILDKHRKLFREESKTDSISAIQEYLTDYGII